MKLQQSKQNDFGKKVFG